MISITTKTGDKGQSGLANGQRADKSEPVFEVIGTLDELNSWLGLIATQLGDSFQVHKKHIYQVQDTLFYIGAEVAQSPKARLSKPQVNSLEKWGDQLQQQMAKNWHTKFVLPGGTELGAYLDITRTVCRRCERVTFSYAKEVKLSPIVPQYLNRLSDYLYLLRCFVNNQEQYPEKQFEPKTKSSYLKKVSPTFKKTTK